MPSSKKLLFRAQARHHKTANGDHAMGIFATLHLTFGHHNFSSTLTCRNCVLGWACKLGCSVPPADSSSNVNEHAGLHHEDVLDRLGGFPLARGNAERQERPHRARWSHGGAAAGSPPAASLVVAASGYGINAPCRRCRRRKQKPSGPGTEPRHNRPPRARRRTYAPRGLGHPPAPTEPAAPATVS
jgi:hypothetical protein